MSEDTQNTTPETATQAPETVAAAAAPVAAKRETHRKVLIGSVVSDKQDKTRVVAVARSAQDPLYKKVVKSTSKYYAHDEKNESKLGDVVEIMETRPLSKMKRWRLVKIQKHAATD